MPIIIGSDLASYPGVDASLTPEQLDWIATQADALVLDAWRDPVTPAPAWVTAIALNVAARFAQNPRGLESYTTSVDDGSHTQRIRAGSSGGGIYLTDNERASLSATEASAVGTIWTTPTRPPRSGW